MLSFYSCPTESPHNVEKTLTLLILHERFMKRKESKDHEVLDYKEKRNKMNAYSHPLKTTLKFHQLFIFIPRE